MSSQAFNARLNVPQVQKNLILGSITDLYEFPRISAWLLKNTQFPKHQGYRSVTVLSCKPGTSALNDRYLILSATSTLVTCWKQQGCDIWLFAGKGWDFGVRRGFLPLLPGTDRLIFSGHAVSLSTRRHISSAAIGESKLSPTRTLWSDDKCIVWKAWPETRYELRLSIMSCQSVKQVPRSAKRIWMRRLFRDLVSPLSSTSTGIPMWLSSHWPSEDVEPQYRFAKEPQTNTWNIMNLPQHMWIRSSLCILINGWMND